MSRWRNTQGSLTIETAILLPVVVAVLLLGCVGISFYMQYAQVEQCFYRTAETMTDYAYLYHEKTISQFTDQWRAEIQKETDSFWSMLLENVPQEIQEVLHLQSYLQAYETDLLDQAESQIYVPVAAGMFQYHLQQAGLTETVSAINFSNSEFFIDGHAIYLDLSCELPFSLPFFKKNTMQVRYRFHVNGWVNGVGGETEEGDAIWELDNFTRGKRIRALYGGNLPDTFPTIAKFENGRATMIKSVDFRKETYQEAGALSGTILTMLKDLYAYQGQPLPYGKEQIVILPSQIQEKELLLVIPAVVQDEHIQRELSKAKSFAETYGIMFTIAKL